MNKLEQILNKLTRAQLEALFKVSGKGITKSELIQRVLEKIRNQEQKEWNL